MKWEEFEEYLVQTRYSTRDNGKPEQKTFREVIERIYKGFLKEHKKQLHTSLIQKISVDLGDDFLDFLFKEVKKAKKFLLGNFIVPSSPILMNFNTPSKHGCHFACFIHAPVQDDTLSIMEIAKELAIVFKSGGGSGVDVSLIRPKNAFIDNGHGVASGPASFTYLFSSVTKIFEQGGRRRGALIVIRDDNRPDFESFIGMKDNIGFDSPLRQVNISVRVRDFNNFAKSGRLDKVAEHAWRTGDPGVLFVENQYRKSPIPSWADPIYVNPCQPADAILLDGNRLRRIDDPNATTWESWVTGEKEVIELKTNIGLKFKCTRDHKVRLKDGTFCPAEDTIGKELFHPTYFIENLRKEKVNYKKVLLGFLFGDGYLKNYGIAVKINPEKEPDIVKLLTDSGFSLQSSKEKPYVYYCNRKKLESYLDENLELIKQNSHQKEIPDYIFFDDLDNIRDFLMGLFEANGSCNENGQISYKTVSYKLAQQIQLLLMAFGIHSSITENPEQEIKWHNGTYTSKKSYNVQVAPSQGIKFKETIGFFSERKTQRIKNTKKNNIKIVVTGYKSLGIQGVWDYRMNQPPHYNFCQGVILKNCGEYMSVAGTACNLFTENILQCALSGDISRNKYTFFQLVKNTAYYSTILANYILLFGKYPIDYFKYKSLFWKPVGVGLTGLHETFALNNIRYEDTALAPEFASEIQQHLLLGTLKASAKLISHVKNPVRLSNGDMSSDARKMASSESRPEDYIYPLNYFPPCRLKNYFPDFDISIYGADYFFVKNTLEKHGGLFNIVTTTQMPSGSGSQLVHVSATGIEPITDVEFERMVFDQKTETFKNRKLKTILTDIAPDKIKYLTKAIDVSPDAQIAVLSAITKHCHTSVSKTINLPNSATVEDVKNILNRAYSSGLKAITVFRYGCKEQVVSSANESLQKQVETKTVLPEVMEAVRYKVKGIHQNAYIVLSKADNFPRECFILHGKSGTKISGAMEVMGRLISLILRKHPEDIDDIIDQLDGIDDGEPVIFKIGKQTQRVKSIYEALSNILSKEKEKIENNNINNNKKSATAYDICPRCGQFSLEKNGGCFFCTKCGMSSC